MDISADLEKRPAARQLRYSLLQYAASKRFAPVKTLDENDLRNLVK
jgi:hypothetical protein